MTSLITTKQRSLWGTGSDLLATEPVPRTHLWSHSMDINKMVSRHTCRQSDGFSMSDYKVDLPSGQFLQGMNCFFTLNMDPNKVDYSNKPKFQFPNVVRLLKQCLKQDLLDKVIIFYEISAKDKLHFHGQFKLKMKAPVGEKPYSAYQTKHIDKVKLQILETEIAKDFSQYKHNTACIQFSLIKNKKSRDTTYKYCTKDNHNKTSCLFYNADHALIKQTQTSLFL